MALPDAKDYLLRPVLRGLCQYRELIDGTLSLYDIAELNDAIDVLDENTWRAQEAAKNGR